MALLTRVASLFGGLRTPALVERRHGRPDFREWSSFWASPWSWGGRGAPDEASPLEAKWLAATQRCIAILSDALAATPLRIVRREEGGGRSPITNTDAARAISQLDYCVKESLFSAMLLAGNGYGLIRRNDRGGIAGLTPIPPALAQVAVSEAGEVWYRFAEDHVLRRRQLDVPAGDVLHLKFRVGQGQHDLLGTPPLALCAKSMGFVTRVVDAGVALYKNISMPSVVLSTDQVLTKQQNEDVRERWNERAHGEAYGGVVVLGWGLKPLALPVEKVIDAQLAEMNKATVAEISRAYGVPLQLLNETSSLNYSTSVELQRAFATFSLIPLGQRVSDALSLAFLSREERLSGVTIEYDFSQLLIGSGVELADFASKLVNGGLATVNEARDFLKLPDIADGDILRAPSNTVPISRWAEGGGALEKTIHLSRDENGNAVARVNGHGLQ